jgi:hypothetical protein
MIQHAGSNMETFCDWDPAQRLEWPCAKINTRSNSEAPNTRTLPSPLPAAASQESAVVVDVTDKEGVHRSITIRPGDSVMALAEAYANLVPGGISDKQFQKLVHILSETVLQHFGRAS